MTILLRVNTVLLMLSTFAPGYAQSSWRTKADSAFSFETSGDLGRARVWAMQAAQTAQPGDPTDSLWQVAIRLSEPFADSIQISASLKAGKFYLTQNQIDKATSYLTVCKQRSEHLRLPVYYLDTYAALAQIAIRRNDYPTARQLYAKIAADSFSVKQPIWRATGLIGLADIASVNQDFDSVSIISHQVLHMLEKLPDHQTTRSYVQVLRLLTQVHLVKNNLSESEKTIDKAYAIVREHYPDDPLFITIGYLYAYVYGDVNDEKALEATHKSQNVLQKQVNYQDHPYYLALLSNRVGLLEALNRSTEAAQVADSVFDRHLIDDLCRLSRFDQFLSRAFRVYQLTSQSKKAASIAEQARRLLAQPGNRGANPSRLHEIVGRYAQVTHNWTEAVEHYKAGMKLDSVDQAASYMNHGNMNRLAICQAAAGQRYEALTTFRFLVDQLAQSIRYDLWLMSESERLNYLSTAATHGLFWYMLRTNNQQADELGLAYDYKLLLQGASLRTKRAINQATYAYQQIDNSPLKKLIDVQSQLANQYAHLASQDRQRLVFTADSLNRQLGDVARLVNQASQPVSWSSVQARLKPGEAAVELIRYENFLLNSSPADSTRYAALVIKSGWSAPRLVTLPALANNETAILSSYSDSDQPSNGPGELYPALWQPIATVLGPVQRVFIALDGIYQLISLPSLFNAETGKYLLDETELVVLNSTQDLLDKQPYTKPVSAELLGYPTYRLSPETRAKNKTNPSRAKRIKLRNGLVFNELPYTKIEVERVARQFMSSKIKTTVRTGAKATEKAVWQWHSPSVVHIATHGFFRDSTAKATSTNLLSCGLALAGAADTTFRTEHIDGILTGYEASMLDLHKTELVVLSACQTGVGNYVEGEGIYGLQRAFLLAGSRAVLVSLREVGDQVTQRFMAVFYQKWLSGLSKPAALRQTQRKLRSEYPSVHSWGAFVLVGQ